MTDTNQLPDRLRRVIAEIRRKPYPIADLIPLLSEAADALQARPQVLGAPVPFLLNGTRFKMSFQTDLDADLDPITTLTCFNNFENQLDGRWVALVAAEDDAHLKLRTAQPAQATQAEVTDADIVAVMRDGNNCNYNDEAEHIQFARAILALRPTQVNTLAGCNCRWDGDNQVEWCELHLAHKEAIHEWAERAKSAEQKLALRPVQVPMTDAQRTASWFGSPVDASWAAEDAYNQGIQDAESHHGITAQAKKETP